MDKQATGLLQKVYSPCLRCNKDVHGYLVPDGRFICPNCDPQSVNEHWSEIWKSYEAAWRKSQIVPIHKPWHRWIQFRLSSALVLTVVAGAMLTLNMRGQRSKTYQNFRRVEYIRYGWPAECYLRSRVAISSSETQDDLRVWLGKGLGDVHEDPDGVTRGPLPNGPDEYFEVEFLSDRLETYGWTENHSRNIAINVATAAGIMLAFLVACEWLVRRR